jgi:hypothetical protein
MFDTIKMFKVKIVYLKGFDKFESKLGTSCYYKYNGCDVSQATGQVMRLVGYVFVTLYPKSRKAI